MRNIKMRVLAGVGSAVVLLLVTGCKTESSKDERSAGTALDDQHISERIQGKLDGDPTYKFGDVKVGTFAGVVQLSGFVNTPAQKARAPQLAQETTGVREVQNGLTLKPLEPTGTLAPVRQVYAEPKQGKAADQSNDQDTNSESK